MRLTAFALVALFLNGCTSVQESFPGRDPGQVWSALVAAAQSPSYDDMDPMERWNVRENEVWADPAGRRIEIYRRLHRFVYQSASRRHEEERRYAITVGYDPEPTPTATFTIRRFAIPAWAQAAGDRYFANVRQLLEAVPEIHEKMSEPAPAESSTAPNAALEELIDPGM